VASDSLSLRLAAAAGRRDAGRRCQWGECHSQCFTFNFHKLEADGKARSDLPMMILSVLLVLLSGVGIQLELIVKLDVCLSSARTQVLLCWIPAGFGLATCQ